MSSFNFSVNTARRTLNHMAKLRAISRLAHECASYGFRSTIQGFTHELITILNGMDEQCVNCFIESIMVLGAKNQHRSLIQWIIFGIAQDVFEQVRALLLEFIAGEMDIDFDILFPNNRETNAMLEDFARLINDPGFVNNMQSSQLQPQTSSRPPASLPASPPGSPLESPQASPPASPRASVTPPPASPPASDSGYEEMLPLYETIN